LLTNSYRLAEIVGRALGGALVSARSLTQRRGGIWQEIRQMSDDFQEAYMRARERYAGDEWFKLPPKERTRAIYEELRAIDTERQATDFATPADPDAGQN
jgi:hypothetical protein